MRLGSTDSTIGFHLLFPYAHGNVLLNVFPNVLQYLSDLNACFKRHIWIVKSHSYKIKAPLVCFLFNSREKLEIN